MQWIALPLLLAVASTAASAPRRAPARMLTVPAVAEGVAADGTNVAISLGRVRGDCNHVRVWRRATRTVVRLGRKRPCGDETSTGSGLLGPTLAGNRALWLTYAGGNIREWSLWTATTKRPQPRRLAFVPRDVEAPGPIVLGEGDAGRFGDILPYSFDRTVLALRAGGSRRFSWRAPARVVALAAKRGELAVAVETGAIVVLDAAGRVLREDRVAPPVDAVRLTGNGVLVQRRRTLELRGAGPARTWTLQPGARLVDAEGTLAVYVDAGAVHALRLTDGKGAVVARGQRPSAQLEAGGLVYASGKRIRVVPIAALLRRLR